MNDDKLEQNVALHRFVRLVSSVSEQRVPDVTSSEEVLVGKELDGKNVRKRNLGLKEGGVQDGSTTVVSTYISIHRRFL